MKLKRYKYVKRLLSWEPVYGHIANITTSLFFRSKVRNDSIFLFFYHLSSKIGSLTLHGNNVRGSLCGPKIIIPHNYPTRILYPSNFRPMFSLFVFCRPPTNFRAVIVLIFLFPRFHSISASYVWP